MSDPPPTRSKRSLSPSAPSSAWNAATSTVRKTSRPNHNISSTVRDAIPDLDAQQLRDAIQQLVNFHPSSREKIADILPTIKPSQSPVIVNSTESKCFKRHVDWCRYFLSDQAWTRHPTVKKLTSCEIVAEAVVHELDSMWDSVQACEAFEPVSRYNCNQGEYFVDAAIAVLDIALLLFERQKRTAKKDHELAPACACVCQDCEASDCADQCGVDYCLVYSCFNNFFSLWGRLQPLAIACEQSNYEGDYLVCQEWLAAVCYATPDGSPHPLRFVLSRYIDLPPLVPNPGPNAPDDDNLRQWLICEMNRLRDFVGDGEMPDRTAHSNPVQNVAALPIPNVAGLSI